jgi:predicted ArsR family transcriptional regulator
MLSAFGPRQKSLIQALKRSTQGMTVDELAAALKITRTAVNQHLSSLEENGFVTRGNSQTTRGRPRQSYVLTEKGIDLFPKQYSWFSALLISSMKEAMGSDGLVKALQQLATKITHDLKHRVSGKTNSEKLRQVAEVMNELSFDARAIKDLPVIEANNCIYHHLAKEHPEVCQFDLKLLSSLTDSKVDHEKCIIRGDAVCRFRFGR